MLLTLCPVRVDRLLLKLNKFPLSRKTIATTPIRSDIFNIGKRMKNEQFYKTRDKIDPKFELIYKAPFEYLTAFSKHVPTFSLIAVSSIIAAKLYIGIDVIEPGSQVMLGPLMSDGWELLAIGVAFYVMNIGLVYAVTKYPLRIYKWEKQYCAMFEGFLPFRPKQYSFKQGDLTGAKSILPWYESIYRMKDRKVLVFSHHFRKPIDFNDMLKKN